MAPNLFIGLESMLPKSVRTSTLLTFRDSYDKPLEFIIRQVRRDGRVFVNKGGRRYLFRQSKVFEIELRRFAESRGLRRLSDLYGVRCSVSWVHQARGLRWPHYSFSKPCLTS